MTQVSISNILNTDRWFFTKKALIYFKTSQLQDYVIYILICGVTDFQLFCNSQIHVKSYLQISILNRLYLFGTVPVHSDGFHNLRNNVTMKNGG